MSDPEIIDSTATTTEPAARSLQAYGEEVPGTDGPVPIDGPVAAIPGVLVLDTSLSMGHVIGDVAAAVNKFVADLQAQPVVAAQAHLAVVTFADTAQVALPFCRIAEPGTRLPRLDPGGNGTNFVAALDRTYEVLEEGIPRLAKVGSGEARVVMRPTIYFVSDGQANLPIGREDGWRQSLARFAEPTWRPNRFAFGFGDADPAVIRAIAAEGCAYFAADGATDIGAQALEHVLGVILKSMVWLSQGAGTGRYQTAAPPAGPGLVLIDPVA